MVLLLLLPQLIQLKPLWLKLILHYRSSPLANQFTRGAAKKLKVLHKSTRNFYHRRAAVNDARSAKQPIFSASVRQNEVG